MGAVDILVVIRRANPSRMRVAPVRVGASTSSRAGSPPLAINSAAAAIIRSVLPVPGAPVMSFAVMVQVYLPAGAAVALYVRG